MTKPDFDSVKTQKTKMYKILPQTQPFAFQFDNGSKGGESFETFRDCGISPKLLIECNRGFQSPDDQSTEFDRFSIHGVSA